jgi:hypothetical protein
MRKLALLHAMLSTLILSVTPFCHVNAQVVAREVSGNIAPNEIPVSDAIHVYFRLIDGLNSRGRGALFLEQELGLNEEDSAAILQHIHNSLTAAEEFNESAARKLCANAAELRSKDTLVAEVARLEQARLELYQGFYDDTASLLDDDGREALGISLAKHKSGLQLTIVDFEATVRNSPMSAAELLDNLCLRHGPFTN